MCHGTLSTNKVENSIVGSLRESVWSSVNTLNHILLLRCIYKAPDSSDNVNDLVITAFIHACTSNFNTKVITRESNYPRIYWNTGSYQSCDDELLGL
ncbi:unnamed protein product [Schistosoma mattheei]|uniref:Uncharacterized protein n=1 Tax=Schistosoma mattheei TaxID=31246 RepID=A0A183NKF3_9TREM|nr:unnamed protein product [Schistosoma mattheei]